MLLVHASYDVRPLAFLSKILLLLSALSKILRFPITTTGASTGERSVLIYAYVGHIRAVPVYIYRYRFICIEESIP